MEEKWNEASEMVDVCAYKITVLVTCVNFGAKTWISLFDIQF